MIIDTYTVPFLDCKQETRHPRSVLDLHSQYFLPGHLEFVIGNLGSEHCTCMISVMSRCFLFFIFHLKIGDGQGESIMMLAQA